MRRRAEFDQNVAPSSENSNKSNSVSNRASHFSGTRMDQANPLGLFSSAQSSRSLIRSISAQ